MLVKKLIVYLYKIVIELHIVALITYYNSDLYIFFKAKCVLYLSDTESLILSLIFLTLCVTDQTFLNNVNIRINKFPYRKQISSCADRYAPHSTTLSLPGLPAQPWALPAATLGAT